MKTSFRKITSVVLAVLMLLSVFAVSASAADTNANTTGDGAVYLDASGTDNGSAFNAKGAVFYAYTWTNGEKWTSGTPEGNYIKFDGLSSGENVIFVRCDPEKEAGWAAKWNQTENLTVDNTLFTITSWSGGAEGNMGGVWSSYNSSETQPSTQGSSTLKNKFVAKIYCEAFGTDDTSRNKEAEFSSDGTLTYTFPDTSYVFVRNDDTGVQYCTDGWTEAANPVTLVNENTTSNFNKMLVPSGQHTLYLVDNGNDTFTLSYDSAVTPTDPPATTEPTQAPTTTPTQAPTTESTQAPTTTPTQGQTTAPTQGSTTASSQTGDKLVAAITLNNVAISSSEITDSFITVSFNLTSPKLITDGDLELSYDASKLTLTSIETPAITAGNIAKSDAITANPFKINFTGVDGETKSGIYDFTAGATVVKAVFGVKSGASGTAAINLMVNELDALENDVTTSYFSNGMLTTAAQTDLLPSLANMVVIEQSTTQPSQPTEASSTQPTGTQATQPTSTQPTSATQATQPTTAPVTPPKTKVTVSAAKTKIYVGKTTIVSATVKNGSSRTLFTSGNSRVATVNATTGVVTGKSEGDVTITATNNGVKATIKIKVIKRNNTMKVTGKKVNVKPDKKVVLARAKALNITGAKGTLAFKKTGGTNKVTVNKKPGKLTVKPGLKKGKTYTVKVNVRAQGDKTYKPKALTVKVKICIKKK